MGLQCLFFSRTNEYRQGIQYLPGNSKYKFDCKII